MRPGSRRSTYAAPFVALSVFALLGVAIIIFSQWLRGAYGRVVIGGNGGRVLIVDAAVLGIGIGVLMVAIIFAVSAVVVVVRVTRAVRFGSPHDLVVPVERVGTWTRALRQRMAHSKFVGGSDPYYCAVAVRDDRVELWADLTEPLLVVPASAIQQASVIREPWQSVRRVLTLHVEGFDAPIALSVMSQRWLIAPESDQARLDEILVRIKAIAAG